MLKKGVECLTWNLIMFMIIFFGIFASSQSLLNADVVTYIDVSSQLVIVKHKITVENKFTKPIDKYLFIVDPQWIHNLSYIEAIDNNGNYLKTNKVYTGETGVKFEILFYNHILPKTTETIQINSVVTNYLQSYPKSVRQNEKHLVLFCFNVYYYSTYFTKTQTTYLYLGTTEVNSVNGAMYTISNDPNNRLKYGMYFNIVPMSEYLSVIHYENNSPFLMVENLDKFIQISHWGYLYVWEHISLVHTGPKLKGPYERPFGLNGPRDTRIESFVTTLPAKAFDVHLKDEIGTISSFHVDNADRHTGKVKVDVRLRIIMYGGWKTQYQIYYSLPISNYVNYRGDKFTLDMSVVDQIYPNMVIKEAKINIILPEGASFQDIKPYFELENNTNNRYCYFLDVICRDVISFKKFHLVEHHGSNVLLTYTYPQLLLLFKPFIISIFLYGIFLLFIIFSDTTLSSPQKKKKQ